LVAIGSYFRLIDALSLTFALLSINPLAHQLQPINLSNWQPACESQDPLESHSDDKQRG